MIAFEDIERACCTTKCEGVARGICPYFGQKDKINRCERIKNYIQEVEDGKDD